MGQVNSEPYPWVQVSAARALTPARRAGEGTKTTKEKKWSPSQRTPSSALRTKDLLRSPSWYTREMFDSNPSGQGRWFVQTLDLMFSIFPYQRRENNSHMKWTGGGTQAGSASVDSNVQIVRELDKVPSPCCVASEKPEDSIWEKESSHAGGSVRPAWLCQGCVWPMSSLERTQGT